MSETSLSSAHFVRSVADLSPSRTKPLNVDVDEIFASGDVRKKLARKLVEGKQAPAATVADQLPERVFSSISSSLSSVADEPSSTSYSSVVPPPPRVSFHRYVEPDFFQPLTFAPWNVFLNCVDTFNCKYIAQFLSERKYLSTRVGDKDEEKGEEMEEEEELEGEVEGEEDFFAKSKRRSTKEVIPNTNYIIFGSLFDPNGKYDTESVREVVRQSDVGRLSNITLACGFIIYDISRNANQIEEAKRALQSLTSYLERLEAQNPEAFKELKEVRTFILISTFMTWARPKLVDVEKMFAPFREKDFRKRKFHPNFKEHFLLEKEVLALRKKWPEKLKTLVLCSGVQYGYEEDVLNFLFKLGWENEPALPLYMPGKNYIPLIHVTDLATMLFHVLERFPKPKYLFAVEQNYSTLKSITKAISKGLTTGDITKLPKEDMKLLKGITKPIFDSMTANVRMEPSYFLEKDKISWTTDTSFAFNITNIVEDYRKSRRLFAKRILVVGPPASGKTTLARKLCGYYQLHYLNPQTIASRSIAMLKYKIERAKAKEKAAKELHERMGEEEESEEEEAMEEEEEPMESIEALREALNDLEQYMESNEGDLNEQHLVKCLRRILDSPAIRNQGYVLDGFPETVQQLIRVFSATGDEVEEEESVDEEDESVVNSSAYPEYIVGLEASDKFILDRVMALPENVIQDNNYEEEIIKKRLEIYRLVNTDDTGILNYFDEREIHPMIINVEQDKSRKLEDTFQKLIERMGDPHKFGLSPQQLEEEERLQEAKTKWEEEKMQTEKEKREKREHEERMRRIEQWAKVMTTLGNEGEEIYVANSLPLRHYLMKYVLPTLVKGLMEVSRVRPSDPLDYLAEFLFKENKEGKMFEPEYSLRSRKLFEEMNKCRDTLFSLTILDEKEKEVFIPVDVKKAALEKELEWDTYY